MSGTARVAVVLTAALAGALLLVGLVVGVGGGPLPGSRDATPTTGPAVDRSGSAGLAPAPGRRTGGIDRNDRTRRGDRADRPDREPRTRSATLPRSTGARQQVGPTRLLVPAADIRMPVRPRGVDGDGLMALPDDPARAGWYRWGAAPRDPRGAVVVAGHVDSAEDGIGPLARVAGLRPGTRVVLAGPGRDTTYRITSVRRVPKRVLDLPALFRRTGPPALHLVTCGGEFDPVRRSYSDNVVAVAERL